MTFKGSVFTANHGYKWSTLPEGMSETQLARYGSVITSVYPEGMGAGDYVQGVIYDGNIVALFSAIRAANWDSANRAARYYAVAFIPREDWSKVHFKHFLEKDAFFSVPNRTPPEEIAYSGPESSVVEESVVASFQKGACPKNIDFSCLGDFLSKYNQLGLNWRFFRSNVAAWHGKEIVFEENRLWQVCASTTMSRYASINAPQPTVQTRSFAQNVARTEKDSFLSAEVAPSTELTAKKRNMAARILRMIVDAFAWRTRSKSSLSGDIGVFDKD